MLNTINKYLEIVEKASQWQEYVPQAERLQYVRELVDIRRGFKKIQFASEERCSTAAFGESQMGKSYLVSALNSEPGKPFTVTDGVKSYNFIDEINPSNPNSQVESTGLVTRFTTEHLEDVPVGYLRVRLLTPADVVLVLCEAYHNQVHYENDEIRKIDYIKKACEEFPLQRVKNSAPILSQDDVMDIQEYLKNTPMHKSVANILDGDSGYFKFMLLHSDYLSDDSMIRAINLLWNENKNISRLFATLIGAYRKMKFNPVVYVPFQAVLKRYGTLLDVARLDEIFDEPETPPAEYCGTVEVRLQDGTEVTMNKGELSALAAELRMNLPTQKDVVPDVTNASRDFLNVLDILDFPGERRPESMDARKLEQGKNLSVVLRRGKVTYLFNRYSDSKRISSLMLCHNNQQSAESTMSSVLGNWINKNVGDTATARRTFMAESVVSPLFIISTFFNKDLECQSNDKPEQFDALRKRWDNRFKIVLEKEVLRANTDEEGTHWFNNWDGQPFKNIFMLRDFKYSKPIFSGYDPNIGTPEQGIVATPSFPDFLGTLKRSFVEYDFVKQHFADPSSSWDDAATLRNDGTRRIISSLNKLAPNVEAARNKKFATDVLNYSTKLSQLLNKYHHDGGVDEEIKKAKRQAAEANFQLGLLVGKDTAGFGSFIDTLMVDEPHIYEIVHREIMNEMAPPVLNGVEESIFIQYGLSTSSTREENLRRLCMGLGVDSEEECKSILESYGVDLEKLLSTSKIMTGSSEHLVEMVENYWFDDYLLGHSVEVLKDRVASVTGIVVKLQKLYKMLDVRSTILLRVNQYLTTFSRSSAINIIADYLAMELNRFVCSFGYDFMSDKQREDIWKNNVRLDLRIDQNTVSAQNEARGVNLLTDLAEVETALEKTGFTNSDRERLMMLPRYGNMWRWMELLKIGYVYVCTLPDYDVRANELLGNIINELKSQKPC